MTQFDVITRRLPRSDFFIIRARPNQLKFILSIMQLGEQYVSTYYIDKLGCQLELHANKGLLTCTMVLAIRRINMEVGGIQCKEFVASWSKKVNVRRLQHVSGDGGD